MRIVEFLSEVFKIFYKDIFLTYTEADLFNTLLFYFDHYPYHNILHQKITEIVMTVLEKNIDTQIYTFLYNTKLVAKILDSANDGKHYTFQSTGLTLNRGYVVFIRKIANKLVELSK